MTEILAETDEQRYISIQQQIQHSNRTQKTVVSFVHKVVSFVHYAHTLQQIPRDTIKTTVVLEDWIIFYVYSSHTHTHKNAELICAWAAKNKQNTPSAWSLFDRHPVLQVFSNLLPWYCSTAQLCLLLFPVSGTLLALTPCFHRSVIGTAHKRELFKGKYISEVLSNLYLHSYSLYCHKVKRKAGIFYLTEIGISWTP